jgi:hypothetical protein
MACQCTVHVRLFEGTNFVTMEPLPAQKNESGTVSLLPNDEFDPDDSSDLFEFLPGDEVRTMSLALPDHSGRFRSCRVATELVRSSGDDSEYWRVLFFVMMREIGEHAQLNLPKDQVLATARRIRAENQGGIRWHYPAVVAWAQKNIGE